MQLTDLEKVIVLEEKIFPDPWSIKAFQEQVEDDNWGGYVAVSNGDIIGYACYYISVHESHQTNIAVIEEFRGKLVAKLLLDNIFKVVKEYKSEFLLLEVRPSNKSAIAFYEKYDFKLLYQRPRYYHSPVEDALVMVHYFEYDRNE